MHILLRFVSYYQLVTYLQLSTYLPIYHTQEPLHEQVPYLVKTITCSAIYMLIQKLYSQLEAYRVLPCATHSTRKRIWILEYYAYIIGGQAIEIIRINIYAYHTDIFPLSWTWKYFTRSYANIIGKVTTKPYAYIMREVTWYYTYNRSAQVEKKNISQVFMQIVSVRLPRIHTHKLRWRLHGTKRIKPVGTSRSSHGRQWSRCLMHDNLVSAYDSNSSIVFPQLYKCSCDRR